MKSTGPRKFVFILMPFEEAFADIYKVGIKPAVEAAGAYCERVDEQIFHESIMERLYNQIAKADLIVADMTGRNPNVFYETGYAHALNKRVVLLTRHADDIPFDLKHYRHIVYGKSIAMLREMLERDVRFLLAQPEAEAFDHTSFITFYIDRQPVTAGAEVRLKDQGVRRGNSPLLTCDVLAFNPNPLLKSLDQLRVALIIPGWARTDDDRYTLPDGSQLIKLGFKGELFPGDWTSTRLTLSWPDFRDPPPMPATWRAISERGTADTPITLLLEPRR